MIVTPITITKIHTIFIATIINDMNSVVLTINFLGIVDCCQCCFIANTIIVVIDNVTTVHPITDPFMLLSFNATISIAICIFIVITTVVDFIYHANIVTNKNSITLMCMIRIHMKQKG